MKKRDSDGGMHRNGRNFYVNNKLFPKEFASAKIVYAKEFQGACLPPFVGPMWVRVLPSNIEGEGGREAAPSFSFLARTKIVWNVAKSHFLGSTPSKKGRGKK